MRRVIALALFLGVFVSGCGKENNASEQLLDFDIELHPDLSISQKITLMHDFKWLESFKIPEHSDSLPSFLSIETPPEVKINLPEIAPQASDWFEEVFGDASSKAVTHFIDQRTNYYLASNESSSSTTGFVTIAANLGANIFHSHLLNGKDYYLKYGNQKIDVEHPSVGIVELTPDFFSLARGDSAAALLRISYLIHESRHSDCTEEINKTDLEDFINTKGDKSLPGNCTYPHVVCPKGHKYAGLWVCDGAPWGAYALSAVFASRLASCKNCSEDFYQIALMTALDSITRVRDPKGLFSGKYGFPETVSSDFFQGVASK